MPAESHNIITTLILLGVTQGCIMGAGLLIFIRRRNGLHWLALGILALSLSLLRLWTHATGLWWHLDWRRIPLAFDLAILPLFYLFALSFTGAPGGRLRRASMWLLPWAVFAAYSVAVYVAGFSLDSFAAKDALAARWHFGDVKAVEDYLTIVISTWLGVLILIRINRYYKRVANWIPEHQAHKIRHLNIMMVILLASMAVNLVHFVSNYFAHPAGNSISHAAYVFYALVIYVLGFIGFRLADVPQFAEESSLATETSLLSKEQTEPVFQRMQQLMLGEKLFTDPDLHLNHLAQHLGIPASQTSRLIKHHTGTNFRSFVNTYRIADVKRKLKEPEYRHCSVLAIALESGFNAESSFYRAFKNSVGMSPSAYRSQETC